MRDRLRKERCGTLDQSQNDRSRACGGGFFSTLLAANNNVAQATEKDAQEADSGYKASIA